MATKTPTKKGARKVAKTAAALEKLQVEYRPIDAIRPNDYNPNRQAQKEFQLLCRSIKEDGFTQPIIVANDGVIVDGEHRWMAAQEIGMTEIPVVEVPMEAAQARIATLRHNRARGTEDFELSVEVLRDLEKLNALEWAADSLGYDDTELDRLLNDIPTPEALAGEEFTQAWIPGDRGTESRPEHNSFSSDAAMRIGKEREEKLRAATNEAERQAVPAADFFRLYLSYIGTEAEIVQEILGDDPANRVVELCRKYQ